MGNFCIYTDESGVCGRKAENRELGLCATHNKERRRGEALATKPADRKNKPTGALYGSTLRQVSPKKAVALKAKKEAYKVVDAGPRICVSCGDTSNLTHSHVLTVKQFPQHEANPENILLECADCHAVWEHDKRKARATQASWQQKMRIWERLEPQDYMRFKVFNPALFPNG